MDNEWAHPFTINFIYYVLPTVGVRFDRLPAAIIALH